MIYSTTVSLVAKPCTAMFSYHNVICDIVPAVDIPNKTSLRPSIVISSFSCQPPTW